MLLCPGNVSSGFVGVLAGFVMENCCCGSVVPLAVMMVLVIVVIMPGIIYSQIPLSF
jgi:hypothetical protein